ncbi:alpha/beta hydrolase-fold protein [Alteromonas ponticola]|uniref:Alpha/beta hydrolase-fold protein n=1 Tax=Alteromonas aquimaris TaxID=2998417 RepID=A0ABT3P5V0_9ALTE|nr:alpha/beta fold hydrolase [Alteromonas aquimaris]MCW8108148.1 alpha/beta hydrolase-fold protein [Alteromonas aquimaris]
MKLVALLFGLSLHGLHTSYASTPNVEVSKGHIETIENFTSEYVEDRFLYVWLPPGYSENNNYDVLYMHDGRMLFDGNTTWNKQEWRVDEVAGALIEQEKVRPFIVVGIPNAVENRHSEYYPQQPFENLNKQKQQALYQLERYPGHKLFTSKVFSDNYSRFLVQEVIPFIESHYNANKGAQHRYIAGSSMGGLISWYTLLNYPDAFAGAICMSTHWPGVFEEDSEVFAEFKKYIANNISKLSNQKVYFDYGNGTLDAMYPPLQKEIDTLFIRQKYPAKLWQSQYFPGEDHSENAWAKRLHIPLEFMFGKKQASD